MNICGEAGGQRGDAGYCPYRNEPDKKVAQIAGLVSKHRANVLLLQEVCGGAPGSHLELLKAALGPGWSFARAQGARPGGRVDCRGSLSGDLGLGIAVKAQITDTTVTQTLPSDPTGQSKQTLPTLCVRTDTWAGTRICTTHVLADPADPRRAQQVKNIKTGTSRRFTWCDADQSLMDRTENEPDSGPPNGYSDHAPLIGYLPGA
ncbi:hypothetical protein AB0C28_43720 [Nonomuraea sp. NPDC048892]|uniref:hypothetical protein n=1 Tax=Nonomuraea sp. NPDC048892 TaxID=3154624 RepID=UPI0033CB1573